MFTAGDIASNQLVYLLHSLQSADSKPICINSTVVWITIRPTKSEKRIMKLYPSDWLLLLW